MGKPSFIKGDTTKTKQQLIEEVQALRQEVADLKGTEAAVRQAQKALDESEAHYRSLYYKTPIMLHSIDGNGRLVSVSEQWLQALGYERDEVIGRSPIEFMTEASRQDAQTIWLPEFFKTGHLKEVEFEFVKKSGKIINILLSAVAERDKMGGFVR
ncbi:PAS domain S-box protein [Chloroflexi bacterium TSY]|nr:PAS domain S-box protein [Chloroflexi bacterium TSY]